MKKIICTIAALAIVGTAAFAQKEKKMAPKAATTTPAPAAKKDTHKPKAKKDPKGPVMHAKKDAAKPATK